MLGIMAVTYQKDRSTLVVNHGSGMCFAGIAGCVTPRVLLPSVVDRPEMLGITAVTYQKDSSSLGVNHGSGMCKVGIAGYDALRVLFPSGVDKA